MRLSDRPGRLGRKDRLCSSTNRNLKWKNQLSAIMYDMAHDHSPIQRRKTVSPPPSAATIRQPQIPRTRLERISVAEDRGGWRCEGRLTGVISPNRLHRELAGNPNRHPPEI